MQNQNKIFLLLVLLALMVFPFLVDARSGCCSHHGGVCGCGCCDGTSLSATCAPYYPQCNSDSESVNSAPSTNYNPVVAGNNSRDATKTEDNSSTWWTLGILGAGGVGIYYYNKNKNKK